jgi:putative ABC transport system permease protein
MFSRLSDFLRALFGRSRFEREMSSELRFHIETYTADLLRTGVPRAEAERRARLEFGGVESVREQCRQSRGLRWSDELTRNVRFALRALRRSPVFATTATVTLALCIGANTTIYSIVDTVLLRPLPYPESEKLAYVALHMQRAGKQFDITSHTGAAWETFRDQATSFVPAVFQNGSDNVALVSGKQVGFVRQQRVSAGFFRVLGVLPLLGREFAREEDRPEGPPVAVLSHSLWTRLFEEDPSAVGQSILLRGEPYTVVGVMPAGFQSSVPADVWTPMQPSTQGEGEGQNYEIMARLRPGTSWAQANTEIQAIGAAIVRERQLPPQIEARYRLVPLLEGLTQAVRPTLFLLWGAVSMVLLVGCVNIAGLLLARVSARRHEIATRMALGGGAMAVLRQILTESLVLGLLGGAAGTALGYAGLKAVNLFGKDHLGIWQTVRLDERILAMTVLTALAAALLFGIAPAIQACRVNVRSGMTQGGSRGVAGGRQHRLRRFLVAGEVALVMMLLVNAGLLIRSYAYLQQLDPGFDPNNVVTARIPLRDARYATAAAVNRLYQAGLSRIRQLPGVESAAVGLSLPYTRALNTGFQLPGGSPEGLNLITNYVYVTPEYFGALRVPLLRGRVFSDADGADSPGVVIVNEAFAAKYLEQQPPLGGYLKFGSDNSAVVGVVGDVQQAAGWGSGEPLWPVPTVYAPATQMDDDSVQLMHTWFQPRWIVRTTGPQQGLLGRLQEAITAVDPLLPFSGFRTMREIQSGAVADQRFQAVLLGTLAGLALMLAAVGLYGLIANSVVERRREMGIRLALGATGPQAVRAVALPGVALGLAGIAIGGFGSWLSASVLQSLVWGVSTTDPLTFGGVALCLAAIVGVASLLPASRVAWLNPADTLRNE